MKKVLYSLSAGLLCVCMSCNNDKDAGDSAAQKNLDASHIVNKAFETGDVSAIDSVVASDFVDHTDRGDKKGTDSMKAMVAMVHNSMKDMKMDIVKELADKDYVFSWMHYTGTSDGTMGGPKGPYDMHGLEIIKFKDGKAIEHWEYDDPGEMMKMMAPQPAMDSTKKM